MRSPDATARAIRALPLANLAAILVAAIGALAFHVTLPSREVREGDYQEVARILTAESEPGDVVLLHPWWTERARLFTPPALPVVGYLGSDVDPLTRHPRIWVLSQPELPRAGTAAFRKAFSPGRKALGPTRELGDLHLTLYENQRHRPLAFSAADAIAQAHVWVEGENGARRDCPFDGRAHRCPGTQLRVAAEWHEIHFQPRRCLWMQPPGGRRARLVVELEAAALAGARTVSLEAGHIWDRGFFQRPGISATRVGVELVDASGAANPLTEVSVSPGFEGVRQAEAELPAGTSRIRLWSQADSAELREACVDLFAWGASP